MNGPKKDLKSTGSTGSSNVGVHMWQGSRSCLCHTDSGVGCRAWENKYFFSEKDPRSC